MSIIRRLLFCMIVSFARGCLEQRDFKSVPERLVDSNLVIAGYTRAVFSNSNISKAEFLVFNTYKGDNLVSEILREREPSTLESALSRRLINASNFACQEEIRVGETYILFLNVVNRRAISTPGPLLVYSRDMEMEIQETLAGIGFWEEWSSCSKSCGGGIQERRRNCTGHSTIKTCAPEDGQERTCNTFACTGLYDILEANGIRESGVRTVGRTTAVQLLSNSSWESSTSSKLYRAFPLEFGLLLTARPRNPGFVFRIMAADKLQFGLLLGEKNVTLSISEAIHAQFDLTFSPDAWLSIAFSFRRGNLTFFESCKLVKSSSIATRVRPLLSQRTTVIVGAGKTNTTDLFKGDIEQLVIAEDPNAAAEQCSMHIRHSMHLDSPSQQNNNHRKNKNDRKKLLEEDMLFTEEDEEADDDEDFAFREAGSGLPNADKTIPLISEDDDPYAESSDEEEINLRSEYNWDEPFDDETGTSSKVEGSGSNGFLEGQFLEDELEWSDWSPCSHSCGWGTRSRTSYCANNNIHRSSCSFTSSNQHETETCFLALCSIEVTTPQSTSVITVPSTQILLKKTSTVTSTTLITTTATTITEVPCPLMCQNGGTCDSLLGVCHCLTGYYGKLCEHVICVPSCQNRGVCILPNKCQCKNGYSGKACQRAVCHQGCQNGGRCISPGQCACSSGYLGKQCEMPYCHPPCYNGGHCVRPYSCHCPPLTTGTFCEKLICDPVCQNGGICNSLGKCTCSKGYKGDHCEKAYCPGGCENAGVCSKSGKCICKSEFHGNNCEKRKCSFVSVNEPYKRSYKQKVVTEAKVPCGAWGWKECSKIKTHYVTVFKTFYRTAYRCVPDLKHKEQSIFFKQPKLSKANG